MTPAIEQRTDPAGGGTDVPIPPSARYCPGWTTVLLVATVFAIGSSALAWQLTAAAEAPPNHWRSLVFLNCAYWYLWALFTPAIVWLSQRARVEGRGLGRALLVHLPAVTIFSLIHIATLAGIDVWLARAAAAPVGWREGVQRAALQNFRSEVITYCAIAGLSHAVLYYREARERSRRTAHLEARLAEAQLSALQQQLQPHFLFNTLHAISALMHQDVDAADRTLARLGDLLRLSLEGSGQREVPLKAELEFLSKYLEIEQIRFADRLTVRFDLQPEALGARVPALILQPLVENAIKHGIAKRPGAGQIRITARRQGNKLWMEVRDDGVGLSEEGWRALGKGIGVSTTRARLLHLFGADFRFEFHRHNPGLAVVVAFPWRDDVDARAEMGSSAMRTEQS